MRTGAAAAHQGYFHEAVYYGSTEDLLAVVVPFLRGGLAAGEPTVVSFGEENAALVRAAMPEATGLSFLSGGAVYARPAAAIQSYQRLLSDYVAGGAGQIRIVGEVPRPLLGATWDAWARYESAINHAYDDFPLWSMCAYDTRTTPAHVLDDVARTHPRVAGAGDTHTPSQRYAEPAQFLTEHEPVTRDPLQHQPPLAELTDPSLVAARQLVQAADGGRLAPGGIEDLVVAVNETVTNALRHGEPPVRVRVWSGLDRIVVTVSDGGRGPDDPFAGLLPASDRPTGGLGLWLTHQLCDHVRMQRSPDGFTVHLIAGNPHPA